MKFAGFI